MQSYSMIVGLKCGYVKYTKKLKINDMFPNCNPNSLCPDRFCYRFRLCHQMKMFDLSSTDTVQHILINKVIFIYPNNSL